MMLSARSTGVTADQAAGCFLGLALGDALGAPVEALPPDDARRYVQGTLRAGLLPARGPEGHRFGQVTDDTQVCRELLLSIVSRGGWDPEDFARRVLNLVASGNLVGAGPATLAAARQLAMGTPWHDAGLPAPYAGNGAAMRAGPLGVLYSHEPRTLARVVVDQARVTHQDPRATAAALLIAGGAAIAARQEPIRAPAFLEELSRRVEPVDAWTASAVRQLGPLVDRPLQEAIDGFRTTRVEPQPPGLPWRGISSHATSSACWSLYAFLRHPDDPWEALCIAIEVGGDTDTLAAMTGALVGARSGIAGFADRYSAHLRDGANWGQPDLVELARNAFAAIHAG
jgi:ADP-ribosylglycohydrolase